MATLRGDESVTGSGTASTDFSRSISASTAEATAKSASYLSRALRSSSAARAMRSICACSASAFCLLTALDWAKICCWASWRARLSASAQLSNRGMGLGSSLSSSIMT